MAGSDPTVVDDIESSRFLATGEGIDAELTYRVDGQRLVLLHAEVAPELRGKGVAGHLVQAAVDRARDRGETLAPRCGYTRRWLTDHPEQIAGIEVDWDRRLG